MSVHIVHLQATEKLVVFLFGIVSHQVADILWHSLGIDQGFLATMGNVCQVIVKNCDTYVISLFKITVNCCHYFPSDVRKFNVRICKITDTN